MAKKVWPVPSSYLAKDDDEVPRTHNDFILRLKFLFKNFYYITLLATKI